MAKLQSQTSAEVSSLCLVGVTVRFWLLSHRQKADYQGLTRDVCFPSL